jgi:hypothetical protein
MCLNSERIETRRFHFSNQYECAHKVETNSPGNVQEFQL